MQLDRYTTAEGAVVTSSVCLKILTGIISRLDQELSGISQESNMSCMIVITSFHQATPAVFRLLTTQHLVPFVTWIIAKLCSCFLPKHDVLMAGTGNTEVIWFPSILLARVENAAVTFVGTERQKSLLEERIKTKL